MSFRTKPPNVLTSPTPIVAAILTPILTSFVYKRVHRRRGDLALNTDGLLHEALEENRLHQTSSLHGEPST